MDKRTNLTHHSDCIRIHGTCWDVLTGQEMWPNVHPLRDWTQNYWFKSNEELRSLNTKKKRYFWERRCVHPLKFGRGMTDPRGSLVFYTRFQKHSVLKSRSPTSTWGIIIILLTYLHFYLYLERTVILAWF